MSYFNQDNDFDFGCYEGVPKTPEWFAEQARMNKEFQEVWTKKLSEIRDRVLAKARACKLTGKEITQAQIIADSRPPDALTNPEIDALECLIYEEVQASWYIVAGPSVCLLVRTTDEPGEEKAWRMGLK